MSPVPRPRVVDADVRRPLQTGLQHLVLLVVKDLLVPGEDVVELAGGDVDAQPTQLRQQQPLGHALAVMLVQHKALEHGAEVVAGEDVVGQGGQPAAAVGQLPTLAAVAGGLGAEDEFLDDVVLVAVEGGAWGRIGQRDEDLAMDSELGVLGALAGAGPFLGRGRRPGGRSFQGAGLNLGSRLEALEDGDLIAEAEDLFLLLVEEVEQSNDERCAFVFGDLRQRQGHTLFYAAEDEAQLLSPGLLS